MATPKELLFRLTSDYRKRVDEAKRRAENQVRTAEAARQAVRKPETPAAQQPPKK